MEEVAMLLSPPLSVPKRDYGQLLLTGDSEESRGGAAPRKGKARRLSMSKDSIPQLARYDEEPGEWLRGEVDDDDLQWAVISGPALSGSDFDVPEASIFDDIESSSEPLGCALGASNATMGRNIAGPMEGLDDFCLLYTSDAAETPYV